MDGFAVWNSPIDWILRGMVSCLVVALLFPERVAAAEHGGPPNIVVIFADDLGYGDLSCQGHATIRTPRLDRMAAEGMRFTQFYVLASVCTPSRAALMTGRYPIRSGLTRVVNPRSEGGIQDDEVTLAEALKAAGYSTHIVGKWHLGHLDRYLPLKHGFDSYFGIPYSNDMSEATSAAPPDRAEGLPPTPLIRGNRTVELEPDQRLLTQCYTNEALRVIRSRAPPGGEPFFLYVAHAMPHIPLAVSRDFGGRSERGLYGDVVEELDWSVGRILGEIRRQGLDEKTIVVFTSDNGPALMFHEDGGSAGLLRGGKGSPWEGGFRVPAIVRWPGRIDAGAVENTVATTMDLYATLITLGGGEIPRDRPVDGRDISGLLLERTKPKEVDLFFYAFGDTPWAVRRGVYKLYVRTSNPETGKWGGEKHDPPLLFDLETDPSEKYDIASRHPEVAAELKELILEQGEKVKAAPRQW